MTTKWGQKEKEGNEKDGEWPKWLKWNVGKGWQVGKWRR
jgi:hypothetical protein